MSLLGEDTLCIRPIIWVLYMVLCWHCLYIA